MNVSQRVDNDSNDYTNNVFNQKYNKSPPIGKRHLQIFFLITGLAISSAHGSALSVGIVAMTNNTINPNFPEYNWTAAEKGVIFSSPFWGFFVASLLSGMIAQKFGAKYPLFIVLLFKSFLITLTSVIASLGLQWMIGKQILEGIAGGFVLPCAHQLMSKWIHPVERNIFAPIVLSGSLIGSIAMMSVSGSIASSSMGWPGIFYISGGAGILWSIIWLLFGASSPRTIQSISFFELRFLESIPGSMEHNLPIPWKSIAKSLPFWALVVSQCGESWGYVMLNSWVPTYIDGILQFKIESNSLFSALPFLAMLIIMNLANHIADYLVERRKMSVEFVRKIFNSIGTWIPAIGLVALGFVSDNLSLAIVLLSLSIGINGTTHSGFVINHMDLSPNFAGTMVGWCIGIGNIMSILSPMLAGYIITDTTNPVLWRTVFSITAAVFFVCNLFYLIFGKGKVQHWNQSSIVNSNNVL